MVYIGQHSPIQCNKLGIEDITRQLSNHLLVHEFLGIAMGRITTLTPTPTVVIIRYYKGILRIFYIQAESDQTS